MGDQANLELGESKHIPSSSFSLVPCIAKCNINKMFEHEVFNMTNQPNPKSLLKAR